MKEGLRIMTGFWYEVKKCIRKSQLIDLAFRGGICIIDFVYDAAEKAIFPIQEELFALTTLIKLKTDAGHTLPPTTV